MRTVFVFLSISLSLATTIPVKKIILYKHGIGYFEREGVIPAGDQARLDFSAADMNDILKSLTVTDASGGRVSGVRYDSNESLDQRLNRYPFKIGSETLLSSFLDSIKGARIQLKAGERTVDGTILGARAISSGSESQKQIVREQITLLLDSGDVANYDLEALGSLRLLDPPLQDQLKQYLQTLSQSRSREKRGVYIDTSRDGNRDLRVSYISPTAIWKSSYRLTLGDANSTLEGWAVVDNTTDEDWNDVKLSVVSGRPISFISLLDSPRYGRRQVAELPEDRAAGPVVYSGSVDAITEGTQMGSGNGVGGGTFRVNPKQSVTSQLMTPAPLAASSIQGATGATLGELFEYNFAGPVTIKKNQSAMLPFLQDKISARKLLIYTERDGEHPVNAAEITNSTSKTLDGGPITVYDSNAYAGEALVETLKAGDKRLIGYAVDYGTRVTTVFDSGTQSIREVHVKDGTLQLRYAEHQTRTYTIRNVDAKAKTLILEQQGIGQYSVLSPKPLERTATAYRFEVKLPANGSQTLKVEQEQPTASATEILSSTPDFLMAIVENKELSGDARKQLQAIVDLKRRIAEADANLNANKSQAADLTEDQTRLRQNIDSLNRVKGQEDQVRAYSTKLSENESQLAKLRDQKRSVADSKSNLNTQLRAAIDALDF